MSQKLKTLLIALSVLLIISIVVIQKSLNRAFVGKQTVDLADVVQTKISKHDKLMVENYTTIEPMPDAIKNLNTKLTQDFNILDPDSLINEIDKFAGMSRESTFDVVSRINDYLNSPSEFKIQLKELQKKCARNLENLKGLEEIIEDNHENLGENQFNVFYFELGLKESHFCERVGTEMDVLWLFVKLARKGDEVAQLLLFEELMWAVNLKHFNIKKYPHEYMQLRDEAIEYLSLLARKGVFRASDLVAQIYSGNESSYYNVVKPNLLLSYYYFSLAVKQANFLQQPYNNMRPNVIYEKLTNKEKIIADRMTRNL